VRGRRPGQRHHPRAAVAARRAVFSETLEYAKNRAAFGLPIGSPGLPGYVGAVIVHWLALPEDQQDLVSADMIAGVAAGAFSGGLSVIN